MRVPVRELERLNLFKKLKSSYLEMRWEPGKLSFTATDGYADVCLSYPADHLDDRGGVLVPAQPFHELLGVLPRDEELVFTPTDEGLSLKLGGFSARLHVASLGVALPMFPTDEERGVRVEGKALVNALEQVSHAMGDTFYLECDPVGVLRIIATDGYRIALARVPVQEGVQGSGVVHKMYLPLIKAVKDEEEVYLRFSDYLTLEGKFSWMRVPYAVNERWASLLPRISSFFNGVNGYVLDAEVLAEALERSLYLAEKHHRRVDLIPGDGTLALEVEGDYGRSRETLPVEVKGVPPVLPINGEYLWEAVRRLHGQVVLYVNETLQSVDRVLRYAYIRPENEGYEAVVAGLSV